MTMPKCSSGVIFKHDKSYAVAQTWSNLLCLWVCRYLYTPTQFLASDEMVYENMIKETDKDKMKLEYKFYEKNLAPKWLEGDYDLHIEGNRMTMTSKDGKKVEARCHPDDDWRLQVGIDELKERMTEVKKPREIKVGDVVNVTCEYWYDAHNMADFFESAKVSASDIIRAIRWSDGVHRPAKGIEYEVMAIGNHVSAATKMLLKMALIYNDKAGSLYVVNYVDLELVE